MKLTILALSSSGGSYPVEFSDDTGVMRMFCHCQAGQLQQMCKHKLALLKCDKNMLFDPAQEKLFATILSSPAYAELRKRLEEYERELTGIGREMAKLKDREKQLKMAFSYELMHGRKQT